MGGGGGSVGEEFVDVSNRRHIFVRIVNSINLEISNKLEILI